MRPSRTNTRPVVKWHANQQARSRLRVQDIPSDKSKTVAGLLQLLSLVGIGGIGRFYIGDIGMGVAQLLVGWLTCGIGLIWSIVDAVLILSDKVHDSQGRPLRDGP